MKYFNYEIKFYNEDSTGHESEEYVYTFALPFELTEEMKDKQLDHPILNPLKDKFSYYTGVVEGGSFTDLN